MNIIKQKSSKIYLLTVMFSKRDRIETHDVILFGWWTQIISCVISMIKKYLENIKLR